MRRQPLGDPTPRAVAVVVRGDRVLVIRRVLDGRHYAVLPGGGIEPGESAADAAVRELAEECSLDGTVVRHLFDGDHGGRAASYFLVDAPAGEPVLGGEEARAHGPDNSYEPLWATAAELDPLGLLPEGIGPLVIEAAWPPRADEVGGAAASDVERVDWAAWHEPYADPTSSLSRRLALIQGHLNRVLDETSPRPVHLVSVCAGDGRDLIEVLAGREDRARVTATLLEFDPRNVERARASVATSGLTRIDVRVADAGDPPSYDGLLPADLVLLAGVFGNVPDGDVRLTVAALPAMCRTGATVIWTRHRSAPDLTPTLRAWCGEAGFEEVAFEAPHDVRFTVGVHRWPGPDGDGDLGGKRLFTFFR